MSLQKLKKEKAKLEKRFKDSDRGGIEYQKLESLIQEIDKLIKEKEKLRN